VAVPADVRAYVAANGLTTRSNWRATGRTAVVVACYAAATVVGAAADHWLAWIAVWAFQGCVLVGSYSAMHEASHGTLYGAPRANRVLGAAWASTILVNWSLWRSFHLEHHAHTGTDDDPKLRYRLEITNPLQYLLLPLGGLAFMGQLWFQSLGTLVGRYPSFVRTRTGRGTIRRDAVLLLLVTAALVLGLVAAPGAVLRVWLVPLLVAVGVVLPATGMTEHYRCSLGGEVFDTTRSVVSNRVFRFLVWNNNFHVVHHLVPAVPFHHAPALHGYIAERSNHLEPSYLRFHLGVLRDCVRP
jgi:fatty acid desaturase